MKTIIAYMCLVVFALAGTGARAELTIVPDRFDFGRAPQNSTLATDFWVHNNGPRPVQISDLKTGCGCLVTVARDSVVSPNDSLLLTVSWQTRAKTGPVTRTIHLFDAARILQGSFDVTARIGQASQEAEAVVVVPQRLTFDSLAKGGILSFSLTNQLEQPLQVNVSSTQDWFELRCPTSLDSAATIWGSVTLKELPAAMKEAEGSFCLELLSENTVLDRVTIPVSAGDFSHRPTFTIQEEKSSSIVRNQEQPAGSD